MAFDFSDIAIRSRQRSSHFMKSPDSRRPFDRSSTICTDYGQEALMRGCESSISTLLFTTQSWMSDNKDPIVVVVPALA